MNPKNEFKSDLCKKRKAGDIEPDTMATCRADHRVSSTDDSPKPQRAPPLKKRFSLDLLSEASAMLAQGFGPSKIQEIVQQQQHATAAKQQQPEQDVVAATDKMGLEEASKVGTQNGESSVPVQPKAESTINSPASNDTLNNTTTSQNAGSTNVDTALAEKTAQKTNDQVPSSPEPQVDEEVKESTPTQTGSETDGSVKESMNTEVPTVKKESPIRTVSETDAPVKESQDIKNDDVKMDTPLRTVAVAAVAVKESEETPVVNVQKAAGPPSLEAATAIKDDSQRTATESATKDTPMQTASKVDSAVKESRDVTIDDLEMDTPMAGATTEGDMSVKEPQATPGDGVENHAAIQTSPEPDTTLKESQDVPIDDLEMDTSMAGAATETENAATENAATEPQETPASDMMADAPMQTASEPDTTIKESQDVAVGDDVKIDTAMMAADKEGDNVVKAPHETPAGDIKTDAPMQIASEPDNATKESENAEVIDVKNDTPMEGVHKVGENAVKGSQATSADDMKTDAPLQTSSNPENAANQSENPDVSDMKNDFPMQSSPVTDNSVKGSQNTSVNGGKGDTPPVQTAAEPDTSVKASVDVVGKDCSELLLPSNSGISNNGISNARTSAASDAVESSATNEEKHNGEAVAQIAVDPRVKETKEENGQQVEEEKQINAEPKQTDESVKGTERVLDEPMITDAIVEEAKAEIGEPMNTDEPVKETKELNGMIVTSDDSAKETTQATRDPVATSVLEKAKEENGECVTNVDKFSEKKGKVQSDTRDKAIVQESGNNMPFETSSKDTKQEIKESTVTDELIGNTKEATDELAEKGKEENLETVNMMETIKGAEEENEPTMTASASPMETNDDSSDPMTSDEAVKKVEEENGEPMIIADENETACENQSAQADKKIRNRKGDPVVLDIRRRIQFGCRDNNLAAAMTAYHEAIENKVKVEAQSFYNLLNLCDGLERSVHVGTPKGKSTPSDGNNEIPIVDEATRLKFAFQLRDHMKKLNLPLNEAAYSAIVRMLSKSKEFDQALAILEESETVQQCKPKLRLYSSLLIAYCEAFRMLDALEIWRKLTAKKLHASEKEYAALMQCATSTGDATVFERVLSDLAEDVLVPSKGTVSRILEWFELAHSFHTSALTKRRADETKVRALLDQIRTGEKEAPPNMGPVVNVNAWQLSSACPIGMKSGTLQTGCLKGCNLNPVNISQRAWNEMRDMNEKIVTEGQVEGHNTQFQGGKKGRKRMDFSQEDRIKEWQGFANFLEAIGHVDVVIDGANVGCFEKNFARAPKHIDYYQIDWVVQHFAKMGKKVLVVLHERHFAKHMMPDEFRWLEQKWLTNKNLYKTPRGMNDDWFWLHVAYTHQSLVVSNDEMRDHHFQMLAPRTFLRWKERHHAHFDFGNWITAEDGSRQKEVVLTLPETYSRRLQRVEDGLVIPLAKRGDSNRFMDGGHVASDDEPEEETYLCIRPNKGQPP
ncbi:MAG: hypothetical protein SGBAC_008043 [Bacillariaceae sp.]